MSGVVSQFISLVHFNIFNCILKTSDLFTFFYLIFHILCELHKKVYGA